MKLRKDRRHLYGSMEEGQQNDEGDYMPKDFADWREIPSEANQLTVFASFSRPTKGWAR